MTETAPIPADWDPLAPDMLTDQRATWDSQRQQCPVAHSEALGWSVLRHADVLQVMNDHETFSSRVSQFPAVPNGFDPPEHGAWRHVLDPFLASDRVQHFSGKCREIARQTVQEALQIGDIEVINELALPYAARVQAAYLGWPALLERELLDWLQRSHRAIRSGERARNVEVAQEFEQLVKRLCEARANARPTQDINTELMHLQIDGRPIDLRELSSVLRNWTVGELGTIAASVGILLHWLACEPDWQNHLRQHAQQLPGVIDEVLRMDGPLIANRRRTTKSVELGGRTVPAEARVSVNWVAANRDPEVFDEPDRFKTDRDPALNLLYGAGIHYCPGAELARLELRLIVEELLFCTQRIDLMQGRTPTRAQYPDAGYAILHVKMR